MRDKQKSIKTIDSAITLPSVQSHRTFQWDRISNASESWKFEQCRRGTAVRSLEFHSPITSMRITTSISFTYQKSIIFIQQRKNLQIHDSSAIGALIVDFTLDFTLDFPIGVCNHLKLKWIYVSLPRYLPTTSVHPKLSKFFEHSSNRTETLI